MLALANENKRKAGAENVEFLRGESRTFLWFTASISFANQPSPSLGARATSSPGCQGFIMAQMFGALTATIFFRWLVPEHIAIPEPQANLDHLPSIE